MPQSTYISSTDPSGALLPDLQQLLYTNFDPSYIPIFGNTYLLKDFQSEVVSEYFRPYQGDGGLEWPPPLAVDNSNNLVFFDQLGQDGIISSTNENLIFYDRRSYLGVSVGILAYSKNMWIGGSLFNLNRPDISFLGEDFKIERLYSFHLGYNFEDLKLSPSVHYKQHLVFKQLDVGTYFDMNPISIGLWYRGIPIDSNNTINSLIGSMNLNMSNLNITYSYDYNLSDISNISGGSHEISLIYNFHFFGKKLPPKNVRFLECPIPNF